MKFAYFAAVSVAVIAQAAAAQTAAPQIVKPPLESSGQQKPEPVTNANVVIKSVTGTKMTLPDGTDWRLTNTHKMAVTIGELGVPLASLKPGMRCVLNGTRAPSGKNTMDTLACQKI